jgi:hypothetical protein
MGFDKELDSASLSAPSQRALPTICFLRWSNAALRLGGPGHTGSRQAHTRPLSPNYMSLKGQVPVIYRKNRPKAEPRYVPSPAFKARSCWPPHRRHERVPNEQPEPGGLVVEPLSGTPQAPSRRAHFLSRSLPLEVTRNVKSCRRGSAPYGSPRRFRRPQSPLRRIR